MQTIPITSTHQITGAVHDTIFDVRAPMQTALDMQAHSSLHNVHVMLNGIVTSTAIDAHDHTTIKEVELHGARYSPQWACNGIVGKDVSFCCIDGFESDASWNQVYLHGLLKHNRVNNLKGEDWIQAGLRVQGAAGSHHLTVHDVEFHNPATHGIRQAVRIAGDATDLFTHVSGSRINVSKSKADQFSLHWLDGAEFDLVQAHYGLELGINVSSECTNIKLARSYATGNDVAGISFGNSFNRVGVVHLTDCHAWDNGALVDPTDNHGVHNSAGIWFYSVDKVIAKCCSSYGTSKQVQRYGVRTYDSPDLDLDIATFGNYVADIYDGRT